ncbi:leukocyte receptor cluster member 1 isoform X2 [Bombina bombina]|uniref:leukocyte receptor cluster member 1 isoform X2 n=1 Tax=Bombina bombina TaxID=8345 RepID=UPI00235A7CA9|nr:leukocyte receptor cluster member 1 isoform X2 [Bombina bombina]
MNILPKKSWHVRNKDNVARVRRDEAQAAEEERMRKKRVDLAEQEARTDFLRKKARLSLPDNHRNDETALVEIGRDSSHVNFFQDIEEGKGIKKSNKEYEEEKRQEKERQEKTLGILTYLGQSAAEAQTSRPWYQDVPQRTKREADDDTKDEKLKGKLDPMNEVEKYLQKKTGEKKKHKHKETKECKKGRHKDITRQESRNTVAETLIYGVHSPTHSKTST